MLGFKFVICAADVVIDKESNRASVFNIIDEFHPHLFPILIPGIVLFLVMERGESDPPEIQVSLRVQLETTDIFTTNIPVRFDTNLHARGIIRLDGVPLASPGKLDFSLSVTDTPSINASYSVQVHPIPAAMQTQ